MPDADMEFMVLWDHFCGANVFSTVSERGVGLVVMMLVSCHAIYQLTETVIMHVW